VMKNSLKATSEQGSELVEFALAITILLTLMFGIIGFAQAAYAYHFVSNVAREATRYASVRGSTCNPLLPDCQATQPEISAYVKSLAPIGINASQLTVTANWLNPGGNCSGTNSPGCAVQVNVQYAYSFLAVLHLPPVTMTSTSQMVISH
jgi:Flp pilus assembly protein TadG